MRWRLDAGQIEVVDEAVAAVLRRKTPAEKIKMIADCDRTMRRLLGNHLHSEFPNWDEGRIQREIVRRMSHGTG